MRSLHWQWPVETPWSSAPPPPWWRISVRGLPGLRNVATEHLKPAAMTSAPPVAARKSLSSPGSLPHASACESDSHLVCTGRWLTKLMHNRHVLRSKGSHEAIRLIRTGACNSFQPSDVPPRGPWTFRAETSCNGIDGKGEKPFCDALMSREAYGRLSALRTLRP